LKRGKRMEKRISILLILLLVLIAAIIILAVFDLIDWSSPITLGGVLEILTLIVLVFVTAMYALSASEQAEASVKMAEETKSQTKILKETVSLTIRPSLDMTTTGMKRSDTDKTEPPLEINIEIKNIGNGVARGLFISCSGGNYVYSEKNINSLRVGEKKNVSICRVKHSDNISNDDTLLLSVNYFDELGDMWIAFMDIYRDGVDWKPNVVYTQKDDTEND